MALPNTNNASETIKRVRFWYGLLTIVLVVFGVRLFFLQVVDYSHYHAAALSDQLKQYQIPASRGIIEAQEGNNVVPIVLNQKLYTLYADPVYIKHPSQVAAKIVPVIGGHAKPDPRLFHHQNNRYAKLTHKLTPHQTPPITALKNSVLGL